MKKAILLLTVILLGCASAQLVSNWKNPDIVLFDASKVLIVGMAQDPDVRKDFETRMQKEFTKRDVEAVRSIDVFDVAFTHTARTEEELSEVEQQLLDKDFDAILFTKVTGSETRQRFLDQIADFENNTWRFQEDYLTNQRIYYDTDYYNSFKVYHAETSLYCICVGKDRELIWRGAIDITEPRNISKTVDEYIKLVVIALEDQDLIFRNPDNKPFSSK